MGRVTTSNRGYSLPDLDEPSNVPKDLKTLGDAVDSDLGRLPYAMAAGVVTANWAGGATQNVLINYPTARFTARPVLTVTPMLGAGYAYITARLHPTGSSSGAYFTFAASGGATLPTTGSINVAWQAVQMSEQG